MGAVDCPRKALMAPTECGATRSVEHTPGPIGFSLTFQGDVSKKRLAVLMGDCWLLEGGGPTHVSVPMLD